MRAVALKHKHLKLNQKKIDFAKRYFGVKSEQEAIDRAFSLLNVGIGSALVLTPQMLPELFFFPTRLFRDTRSPAQDGR